MIQRFHHLSSKLGIRTLRNWGRLTWLEPSFGRRIPRRIIIQWFGVVAPFQDKAPWY